jgi:hypothetical protein
LGDNVDLIKLLITVTLIAASTALLVRSLKFNTLRQSYPRIAALSCAMLAVLALILTPAPTHSHARPPSPKTISFDQLTQYLQANTVTSLYTLTANPSLVTDQGAVAFVKTKSTGWVVAEVPPGFTNEFQTLVATTKTNFSITPPEPIYTKWSNHQNWGTATISAAESLWFALIVACMGLIVYALVAELEKYRAITRLEIELGLRTRKINWLIYAPRPKQ